MLSGITTDAVIVTCSDCNTTRTNDCSSDHWCQCLGRQWSSESTLVRNEDIVMHTLSGLPGSRLIYSVLPVQYTSENCDGWRLVPFRLLQVS